MRVIVALKKHRRVLNRAIHGITDHSGNDCGFLIVFDLAMNRQDAPHLERNANAKYPDNAGDDSGHRVLSTKAPINSESALAILERHFSADLLRKLVQLGLRLSMIGMLLQQFEKHAAGFFPLALYSVYTRKIQIGLVVLRRHSNRFFETVNGFLWSPRAQIKHAQVIQSLRINRAQLDSTF